MKRLLIRKGRGQCDVEDHPLHCTCEGERYPANPLRSEALLERAIITIMLY